MNYNFPMPRLVPFKDGAVQIEFVNNGYGAKLLCHNEQFMCLDLKTFKQFYELVSHDFIAHGHVICTGLGFLIREAMLLQNPRVTKITVLERETKLIDFQNKLNPEIMSNIEVVNCDAEQYRGRCDTFSMDHIESAGNWPEHFGRCLQNIECQTSWFWPLELYCDEYSDYLALKRDFPTLPDISPLQLHYFINMFFQTRYSSNLITEI